ncbi:MAG TPA: TonB-dependent receptor [Rhizobacter sp.]|nr:TonB-dependent receptor [Rhizobacter sp.]
MTFPIPGRAPAEVFALSVLASACSFAAAQTAPPSTVLPPVTVTATRFVEDANTLPFGVSVVTARDIRNAGVTTVNEALMKLLGVAGQADLYGGGNYGLDLRGFGSTADNNQVVIVDGVRISEADMGGTRLAGIPIDSVERIEVVRASSAVLYGEGATAGAIVITTKAAARGQAATNSAQAYMGMGSDSLLDLRGSATLAAGGFSLDVAGNKRSTDGYRDNFKSDIEGLAVTGQWRNEWLRAGVRTAQDKLHSGLPGALSLQQFEDNPRQTNNPTDFADIDNHSAGLFGEALLGNWTIALDAGERSKTLVSQQSFSYAYDIDASTRSARVRHAAPFGDMHNTLAAGVDRDDWTRVIRGSFGSTADQTSTGFYARDDLKLAFGTTLSAGVRSQHVEKTLASTASSMAPVDDRRTAWDVGVVQPVAHGAALFARFGTSFRFPNADEFSFTSMGADLRPQTSRDLDFGGRWTYGPGRAELRFYRNELRDEIGYDPEAPNNFGPGANVNYDPTLRQGVELEARHDLNTQWLLRFNAAARQAKFTEGDHDGKSVALVPKYTVSFGADWQLAEAHKLNGQINMVSSQYVDFANTCSVPSHTTADLRYAYQAGPAEFALGVSNLTDKQYYTLAYACVGGAPSAVYPEAGRKVTASLRVGF